MPIRGSPNGAGYLRPQAGRDRPESVVAINRNGWSQSIGMAGRDRPVRAVTPQVRSDRGPECRLTAMPFGFAAWFLPFDERNVRGTRQRR